MAANTRTPPPLKAQDEVQFVDDHRVSLPAGDFRIEASSNLKHINKTTMRFSIAPERLTLDPSVVQSVFPPNNSRGDVQLDLPHVVLSRSTLPWERTARRQKRGMVRDPDKDPPWLALLVLTAEENRKVTRKTVKWGSLKPGTDAPHFPRQHAELSQHDDDQVAVIDIPRDVAEPLLAVDLDYHAHARRRLTFLGESRTKGSPVEILHSFDATIAPRAERAHPPPNAAKDDDKRHLIQDPDSSAVYEVVIPKSGAAKIYRVETETAVIIANRLPKPGERNTVHLVSVEGWYDGEKTPLAPNLKGVATDATLRFITLHQWSFFCDSPAHSFMGLLENLNKSGGSEAQAELHLPPTPGVPTPVAELLGSGHVPLRHQFRQGDKSVSWYRGPLVPDAGLMPPDDGLDVTLAGGDARLRYDQNTRMFDTSHSAAWELGRMLTLRNRRVALALFNWKRSHAQSIKAAKRALDLALPVDDLQRDAPDLPPEISAWFESLSLLHEVPFDYLVPDERMLPPESLRFFRLDPGWLDSLRAGAFSVGRVLPSEVSTVPKGSYKPHKEITGFLLRSELVSGWHGLTANASKSRLARKVSYMAEAKRLKMLRLERVSPSVMIGLFAGRVKTLDLHLRAETLHFGFDQDNERFRKTLRNSDGTQSSAGFDFDAQTAGVWHDADRRILSLSHSGGLPVALCKKMKDAGLVQTRSRALSPHEFALQMNVGVPLMRFYGPRMGES